MRRGRCVSLVAITLAFVSVAIVSWMAPAGARAPTASYSKSDCDALVNMGQNAPQGSNNGSTSTQLANDATTIAASAKEISDKKLKAALVKIAAVYKDMSDEKNATGIAAAQSRGGKAYFKAQGVYTKALIKCST